MSLHSRSVFNQTTKSVVLGLNRVIGHPLIEVFLFKQLLSLSVCAETRLCFVCRWFQNILLTNVFRQKILHHRLTFIFPWLQTSLHLHVFYRAERQTNRLRRRPLLLVVQHVVQKLNGWWSALEVELKTPINDLFILFTDIGFIREAVLFDFSINLSHVFAVVKGLSIEAFIECNPQGPYFWFLTVFVMQKRLRGHIRGRAHVIFEVRFGITFDFAVAKVNDFGLAVVEENVSWFKISMEDSFSDNTAHPL